MGYDGTEIKTKDGLTIQGVLIKEGDPLMMRSMGGVTQIIPADRVGLAPADAGVADDERRAAGPDRAGRRRPRRVPARATDYVASGFSRKMARARTLPPEGGSHAIGFSERASGWTHPLEPPRDAGADRRDSEEFIGFFPNHQHHPDIGEQGDAVPQRHLVSRRQRTDRGPRW